MSADDLSAALDGALTRLAVKRRELDRAAGLARDAVRARAQGHPELARTIIRQALAAEHAAGAVSGAVRPLAEALGVP